MHINLNKEHAAVQENSIDEEYLKLHGMTSWT